MHTPIQLKKIYLILSLLAIGASTTSGNGADAKAYSLRELDMIAVQVFGEESLSKQTRIDGSGQIRMGLIGSINISGLTIEEAEEKLERTYKEERYLRDPQISIEVLQYAPLYVHVFGQVNRPGRIHLEGEQLSIPILDLISAAGGFTSLAKSDSVRITRKDKAGKEEVVVVNVENLIHGKASDIPEDFKALQPDDVLFVPERLF